MAGIYVHIPFCRKACHYCNFHFSTSFRKKDELISALLDEIRLQSTYLGNDEISTLYFGGGTPSALPVEDIRMIIERIRDFHSVLPDAEITLEVNPDDVTAGSLDGWKRTGVNRFSIGIQAFQDELLTAWNRSHNAAQARQSVLMAQSHGFHNISADLIYGGEGLSDEEWKNNIGQLVDLHIPHVSAYALTVEKGTVLDNRIQKGKVRMPDDEQSARQYGILQSALEAAGFEQYEVSNFAKPGFRSRHNTSYWQGIPYLGIGPSAHSYDGASRQWNVAHNIKYIHAIRNGSIPAEKEILSDIQRYNELVMTGLRTKVGIDHERVRVLGSRFEDHLVEAVLPFMREGKIFLTEKGNYALMPAYYFFADGIAAEMFLIGKSSNEPA